MCKRCGCQQFIKEGKEAILKRVVEIIGELKITPDNVDDYECAENIPGRIAPFGIRDDETYKAASEIIHITGSGRTPDRDKQYQTHVRAFQDVFLRLPVHRDPKHIATSWHQLEQLARELKETIKTSLDPELRQTIEAVNHVHDDRTRAKRLNERYGL